MLCRVYLNLIKLLLRYLLYILPTALKLLPIQNQSKSNPLSPLSTQSWPWATIAVRMGTSRINVQRNLHMMVYAAILKYEQTICVKYKYIEQTYIKRISSLILKLISISFLLLTFVFI